MSEFGIVSIYLLVGVHDLNNDSAAKPCVFTSTILTFSRVLICGFVVCDSRMLLIYLLRLCLVC